VLVFVVIDSASVNSEGFNKMQQVNVVMTEHTEHLESSVKRGGAQQDVEKSYGKENCTYGDDDDHDEQASGMDDKGRKCWTKSAIQRAIIIIIDALRWQNMLSSCFSEEASESMAGCSTLIAVLGLVSISSKATCIGNLTLLPHDRFDFVAHSSNFPGEPQAWMDKLPVLQRLARENRNSARIFKFVADPPTTTLQRLKVGVCTNPKCECNLVIDQTLLVQTGPSSLPQYHKDHP
jgi:hypothetical protein